MDNIKASHARCEDCPLQRMPCVYPYHPVNWTGVERRLLIVGEAPGEEEVAQGQPFVGRSGQLLHQELSRAGIEWRDAHITNAVLCRPPGNKMSDYPEAIEHCRPRLMAEILEAGPDRVLVLGATALNSVLPTVEGGIMSVRGSHYFSEELGMSVVVAAHPAYLLRMPTQVMNFRKDLAGLYDERNGIPDTEFEVLTAGDLDLLPNRIIADLDLYGPINEDGSPVTCDIESSDYKPWKGRLLCVQLSWKEGHSVIIPEELLTTQLARDILTEVFALPVQWYGHNFAFDYLWLKAYGFNPPKSWMDTMNLQYLSDETPGTHGLKAIGQDVLGIPDWEADIRKYLPNKKASYALIPTPVLHRYAARDTDVNLQIIGPVCKAVDESGWKAYRKVMQPAQVVLAEMEEYGMLLDVQRLEELRSEYMRKRNGMLYYMQQIAWKGFNPNSPKQVAQVLFDMEGFKPVKYNKTGPSTDDEVLEELLTRDPNNKFLLLMDQYRSIDKVIGTYLEGLLRARDGNDVVHPDFNLIGTVTGRMSAGVFLTLPRVTKNKWAGAIRDLIIARPGYLIVGGDYSQAELRVMACEAQEDVWKKIWEEGRNLHDEMCFRLFDVHKKQDHEAYMVAKMFTFGLGYGRTAESIARQLKWPLDKARMFYAKYMDNIPQVKRWQSWIHNEVRSQGYLETAFGRKRRFPMIPPGGQGKRILNEALNFIPQSTANDLALMSLTQYYHEMVQQQIGHPILMMHDGIYLEVKEEHAEAAGKRLAEIMQEIPAKHYDTYVPFPADVKIGTSWGAAERSDE